MSEWKLTLHNPDGTQETTTLNMSEDFDELVKEEEKLWCDCGGVDNPDVEKKYVEDYMGVDHGWICSNCGKFVQIG